MICCGYWAEKAALKLAIEKIINNILNLFCILKLV
jgi:hypothetical protein